MSCDATILSFKVDYMIKSQLINYWSSVVNDHILGSAPVLSGKLFCMKIKAQERS